MNESILFLIGFVVFGVSIAATIVGTIAGSDEQEQRTEKADESESSRVVQPAKSAAVAAAENSPSRVVALV